MKVILQKDVEGLGQIGDVVRVADGYGFNYLIPRGLALRADERNVRQFEHLKRVTERKRQRELEAARKRAERINRLAVTVRRRTAEDDRLFGSVTNRDLAEALAQEGIEVDRRDILLDEPIKAIGVYQVPVRVHREVEARFKVYVIREE